MNKDRIQIDGIWYVKEDTSKNGLKDLTSNEIIKSVSLTYETDKYYWEATMLYLEDFETLYPDVSIKFKDKRGDSIKAYDYWDNPIWFADIFHNKPSAIKDAKELMCDEGLEDLKSFLKFISMEGWLNL